MRTNWREETDARCPHGLTVVLVDGTYVRDHYDSDFSQGGNGYRYDFVPRHEIWVDAQINPAERPCIVLHECLEVEHMKRGLSYSRAHDLAKASEDLVGRGSMPIKEALTMRKTKKPRRKLTAREREVVARTVPEEMGKFPQKQAVAVGIARARRIVQDEKVAALVRKYR